MDAMWQEYGMEELEKGTVNHWTGKTINELFNSLQFIN